MKIEIIIQDGYRESLRIYEEHESNGMYTANKNIEEANYKKEKGHGEKKDGEEVLDETDADGDKETDVHNDKIEETIERLAKSIRETTPEGDSINDTKKFFTENQVLEKLKKKFKEITGKELEEEGICQFEEFEKFEEFKEIIKKINEDIENEAEEKKAENQKNEKDEEDPRLSSLYHNH